MKALFSRLLAPKANRSTPGAGQIGDLEAQCNPCNASHDRPVLSSPCTPTCTTTATPLPMTRDELGAWLRLILTPGIGPVSAYELLRVFGHVEALFAASSAALRLVVSPRQTESLLQVPPLWDGLLSRTLAWLDAATPQQHRAVITLGDPLYPSAFLNLDDPPLLIHALGAPAAFAALQNPKTLAVVGSRNPTPAGLDNALAFSQHLAEKGVLIVSGLARGIDGAAHRGALQGSHSQGAPVGSAATVAFVGTGLDQVYPQAHRELAKRIAQQGLLISEYPLGTPPLAANFPKRNRLISAFSQGVLVVEAGLPSGSLVTARLSMEQGKEVFAIPGSIHSPTSRGCHALIKQGAKLVEKAQDILDELPHLLPQLSVASPASGSSNEGAPPRLSETATEKFSEPATEGLMASHPDQAVLAALGYDVVDLDTLQARCGWATPALQAALMRLELSDQIAPLGGGFFQRRGLA